MKQTTFVGLLGLVLMTSGCSESKTSENRSAATDAAASNAADSAKPGKAFEELMAQDWTIDPGVEDYWCVFQTLTEDLWVSDFKAISPAGTHHVTLGYSDPGPPDGSVPYGGDVGGGATCNGITLGTNLAFGGLVGTEGFSMPEGVAVKIPAGKQLLLSVHVSNTNDAPLSGRTGVEVVRADPAKVKNQAEIIFVDNVGIQVPPGKVTQSSACTVDGDSTVFAVLHHMHLTGVHMTTSVVHGTDAPVDLLDEDYDFNAQTYVPVDPPVAVKQGDKLQVTCQYENPGPDTLAFGESTDKAEMCITAVYRYPAIAASFNCFQ